jgi:hypothetical protein
LLNELNELLCTFADLFDNNFLFFSIKFVDGFILLFTDLFELIKSLLLELDKRVEVDEFVELLPQSYSNKYYVKSEP